MKLFITLNLGVGLSGGDPTTLLTRLAEELPPLPRLQRTSRRAPAAGGYFYVVRFESADRAYYIPQTRYFEG
jgi:hypothetical protein